MHKSIKFGITAGALLATGLFVTTTPVNATVFDNRQNVNVLNSDTAVITAFQTTGGVPASNLNWTRDIGGAASYWEGGVGNGANPGNNYLQADFGVSRNIKTIRAWITFAGFGLDVGSVETSPDGITWTPQSGVFTPGANQDTFVLNTAVDARYLRYVGSDPADNATKRWAVNQLQVLGDTGTLPSGMHLDLVSGSAFSGGLTLTRNGSVSSVTTDAEFINDAQNPMIRKVMYSMGTGDGFTLAWGDVTRFGKFGFVTDPFFEDAGADFILEASLNGTTWNTVYTGTSQLGGVNTLDLGAVDAQFLRFTYTSTSIADNHISDVFAFEAVPEPSTFMLLGLGGLLVWRRLRRNRK